MFDKHWLRQRVPFLILILIGASIVPEQWNLDFLLGCFYTAIAVWPLPTDITPVRYDVGERYPGFPDCEKSTTAAPDTETPNRRENSC